MRALQARDSTASSLPGFGSVAIELCCGMGAIGLALRSFGYSVAHAYDSWETAVKVYNHNAPEQVAVACDLLTPRGFQRVQASAARLGDVDLLASGPPCKGFSRIRNGHANTADARRHNLVLAAMPNYVAAVRPRVFFIENVPNLVRHQRGQTFRGLLTRLREPGPRGLKYRVEHGVFDAALHGTPQSRRRLFILGVRVGAGGESLPPPDPDIRGFYAAIRHNRRVLPEHSRYLSSLGDPDDPTMTASAHALSDLPELGPGATERPRAYASDPVTSYQEHMRECGTSVVSNTQTPNVRPQTVARLAEIPQGGCARHLPPHLREGLARRFGSAYRRLHPMAPSTALSTKYDCVYHYKYSRSLSVREYARLQSLPDSVNFPSSLASRRSAYELIGNSVPPLLVRAILGRALSHIEDE